MSGEPGTGLELLHADNHLLAVRKPANLPAVPDESGDESLLDRARAWVKREYDKPGAVYLGVVHRLDRPVSGVMLFARTSKAAARLTEQFRSGSARKLYWAVVEGVPRPEQGESELWLEKDSGARRVHVRRGPGGAAKLARTAWRTLRTTGGGGGGSETRSLVELRPATGRSHQLRVTLAGLGAPILGDLKYGAARPLADRSIALHARRLEIEHPTLRQPLLLLDDPPATAWWEIARELVRGAEDPRS